MLPSLIFFTAIAVFNAYSVRSLRPIQFSGSERTCLVKRWQSMLSTYGTNECKMDNKQFEGVDIPFMGGLMPLTVVGNKQPSFANVSAESSPDVPYLKRYHLLERAVAAMRVKILGLEKLTAHRASRSVQQNQRIQRQERRILDLQRELRDKNERLLHQINLTQR